MAQEATKLMPGEDPFSIDIEDVRHWRAVYAELVAMARSLVKPPPSQTPGTPAWQAANREMEFIQARLSVPEDRLDFWHQRLADLETAG